MQTINGYDPSMENEEQYIYRICSLKDELGATWEELAEILNANLGHSYNESAYRKKYQQFIKMLNGNREQFVSDDTQLKAIKIAQQELEKEKIKLRRERIEYNKLIREQADREIIKEQIIQGMTDSFENKSSLDFDYSRDFTCNNSANDMLISFSDVHAGIEIQNFWNTFNQDELKVRVKNYLNKIIQVQNTHKSENLYIVMSELISGFIHPTLRIENNMDVIQQFTFIIECLSEFIGELSHHFNNVHGYVSIGNHSRLHANKKENIVGENMDFLAIPYLKAKLALYPNVYFYDNKIEETVAMFNVRGNVVMAAHGDRDDPNNVVEKFTMLFGIKPQIVCLGHKHTNMMMTKYDTKILQCGSMSGADRYAIDHRLKNRPEQYIAIIDSNGLDCLYDFQLD